MYQMIYDMFVCMSGLGNQQRLHQQDIAFEKKARTRLIFP